MKQLIINLLISVMIISRPSKNSYLFKNTNTLFKSKIAFKFKLKEVFIVKPFLHPQNDRNPLNFDRGLGKGYRCFNIFINFIFKL